MHRLQQGAAELALLPSRRGAEVLVDPEEHLLLVFDSVQSYPTPMDSLQEIGTVIMLLVLSTSLIQNLIDLRQVWFFVLSHQILLICMRFVGATIKWITIHTCKLKLQKTVGDVWKVKTGLYTELKFFSLTQSIFGRQRKFWRQKMFREVSISKTDKTIGWLKSLKRWVNNKIWTDLLFINLEWKFAYAKKSVPKWCRKPLNWAEGSVKK